MIFRVRTRYYDEDGTPVGRSVIVRKEIHLDDVRSIEEVYNNKVQLMKSKCMLVCAPPLGNVVVEKAFDEMKKIMDRHCDQENVFIKGFKRYDR